MGTIAELAESGVAEARVALLASFMERLDDCGPVERWRRLIDGGMAGDLPFTAYLALHRWAFADWDPINGPAPAWLPDTDAMESSNLGRLIKARGLTGYRDLHRWSIRERSGFWSEMIQRLGIRFTVPFDRILDADSGAESPVWLPGARLNITSSCFQADPQSTAVVYQGAGRELRRLSYAGLAAWSARVANGLRDSGFRPGDSIAVILPMTAESVAIYLGIIGAGCVVVSISDSFAAGEIASRLRLTDARAVFTQDHIARAGKRLALYERVIAEWAPPAVVVALEAGRDAELQRAGDRVWSEFLSPSVAFDPVDADPADPTNFLFSSGTTGDPKVIPWTQTTPIKCAADAWLHHDTRPGDVLAWPTNLGWMMGPWLIYAALINRATIALCADVPTSREFGRFVEDAGVTMLGLVPSLVRSWRASGCMEGLDWSRIRLFSSTGECSNVEDMHYLMWLAGCRPIIEYCGGTEIGGAYLTGTVVQPASPAVFSTPALGLDIDIVDEAGEPATIGEVLLIPPSIGLSDTLWNGDHHGIYFAGTPQFADGVQRRRHGDEIEALAGGGYRHHGRVDDTMNLGGIKVSSVELERVLNGMVGVIETAAISVPTAGGGPDRLVVFLVTEPEVSEDPGTWRLKCQEAIRRYLNPLFKVADVRVIDRLPRTASNKIMRRSLRAEAFQAP